MALPPETPLTPSTIAALATQDDVRRQLPKQVFVGAAGLGIAFGAPTLDIYQALPVWTLGDAVTRGVSGVVTYPTHWRLFDIALVWVNTTAVAGDVRFRLDRDVYGAGDVLPQVAKPQATYAAAAVNVISVTTMATRVQAELTGPLVALGIYRFGSDAADTLAGPLGVLGFLLTQRN